ncbi:hypothetical protein [Stutzerimonas nitrititolerans]|uniref:hypothetical protein n=1 Tax=Stutzerimonas nitrititolerans TaxID=2482751 RepID=UPI000718A0DB|nr:hypothetical protein [Stutzerimonas nitrititolerans]KRW70318.1 hypothetical protein AO729_16115 [Pseudomonas sp. TTU2014-066ASC]
MASQTLYLLDSDAAKKLCQYQLLHELTRTLGCSLDNFAVLPQLRFQLKLDKDDKALAKLGTQEAVNLARELVAVASSVEIEANDANPLLQLNRPDIDSGEATLFAALHGNGNAELCSGDKRAFIALSAINDVSVVDILWARLICLEEAIYLILQSNDFQVVSDKVRAQPDVDMSIGIVFGRAFASSQDSVIEALRSYMRSLAENTGGKYLLPD